ncbi:hypothetical protein L1987_40301 [Smallanthus sonchifolius]|uniref:Uncharacterized protein n=1 Tax=Smallanthus sonchifolius TaxID=185202 RepID=A0ACB9GTK7_9ASTR|nr:hypothetical protein L1987_40301 [Smallanthus sonchifolius]
MFLFRRTLVGAGESYLISGLQLEFFWSDIGNGEKTSLWFDRWCDLCPLSSYVSPRQMNQEGLSIFSTISEVVHDSSWDWPEAWRDDIPVLYQLRPLRLNPYKSDEIKWRNEDGSLESFSTRLAWNALRSRGQETSWHNLIWSSVSIPRHAFMSWLIFRRKLSTQDRIQVWNLASGSLNLMCCLLCYKDVESHNHLFFECSYSNQIWCSLRSKGGMSHIQGKWDDIATWLIPRATSKSARVVIAKLLMATIAYYIWQERNARFFKNQLRPPEKVEKLIVNRIRLKLHSLKFKMNDRVRRILDDWKIASEDVRMDD